MARSRARGRRGGTARVTFFALNNTDKETIGLDLKEDRDREYLRRLLADADVLVENLRPGALAKLGFGRQSLGEINPGLIYCSISGFGIESAIRRGPRSTP